jgi:hypothetical protein
MGIEFYRYAVLRFISRLKESHVRQIDLHPMEILRALGIEETLIGTRAPGGFDLVRGPV